MPKKSLAPEAQRYELYPGVQGLPSFRGVNTEKQPGQLSAIQFRELINLRVGEDGIGIRPGEVDVTGDNPFQTSSACVRNIHQFHCDPLKLWIGTFGCPGPAGGGLLGGALAHFDPEQEPQTQYFAYYKASTNRDVVIGVYSGELYIGDGSNFKKVTLGRPMYGLESLSVEASPPDVLIKSFPGYAITAMGEKFGKFFIGLVDLVTPTASKIVVYDGISIEHDKTGIRPPTAIYGGWREHLVVGFEAAENMLRIRDSAGTWTNVNPSAGTVATISPQAIVSCFDDIFIADGAKNVWRYNGTTLAIARTIAAAGDGTITFGLGVTCVEKFGNRLVYGWVSSGSGSSQLGAFDNTGSTVEWIDVLKDLTAQFSNLRIVYGLRAYGDLLYAIFFGSDPLTTLIASPNYNLASVDGWVGTNPSGASGAYRPFHMVVYGLLTCLHVLPLFI